VNKERHPYLRIDLRSIMIPLLGTMMLFSCQKNDIEVVNNLTRADSLPVQSIHNLETTYTDSARKKMQVFAPLVKRYRNEEDKGQIIFPEGIRVFFYDSNEEVESWLSSKHAIYYEKERLWEASDSVVTQNSKGEILNTELLFWDETEERIYSPSFVQITTKDEVIYGDGFESDQSFTYWNITKVKGTIYQENEK
jgi:LPS export ABC transporter protein LptC